MDTDDLEFLPNPDDATLDLEIEGQLEHWLAHNPKDEELLEYAGKISDEMWISYENSVRNYELRLFYSCGQYFRRNGWGVFVDGIDIQTHFLMLHEFAAYNQASIVRSLGKKIGQDNLTLPVIPDVGQYTQAFLGKLQTAIAFITAPYELEYIQLTRSVLPLTASSDQYIQLFDKIAQILNRMSDRVISGRPQSVQERENDQSVLRQLMFLPEEVIQRITSDKYSTEGMVLYRKLIRIDAAIRSIGIEGVTKKQTLVFRLIWEMLKEDEKLLLLGRIAADRKLTGESWKEKIASQIDVLWTVENLREKSAAAKTLALTLGLSADAKVEFRKICRGVLAYNLVLTALFGENLQPLLAMFDANTDDQVAPAIQNLASLDPDPELHNDQMAAIQELSAVFLGLPQPSSIQPIAQPLAQSQRTQS